MITIIKIIMISKVGQTIPPEVLSKLSHPVAAPLRPGQVKQQWQIKINIIIFMMIILPGCWHCHCIIIINIITRQACITGSVFTPLDQTQLTERELDWRSDTSGKKMSTGYIFFGGVFTYHVNSSLRYVWPTSEYWIFMKCNIWKAPVKFWLKVQRQARRDQQAEGRSEGKGQNLTFSCHIVHTY